VKASASREAARGPKGYLVLPRIHSRVSRSALYRTTASIARRHSRLSAATGAAVAATAAAGVLGAAGFAPGATPWTPTVGNAAQTTPGGWQSAADQPDPFLYEAFSSFQPGDGKTAVSPQTAVSPRTAVVGPRAGATHSAATRDQPATAGSGKHATKQATRRPAAKKRAPAAAAKSYRIYDSVTPGTIPSGQVAAVYANGAYATSAAQVTGHHSVLWIDTDGSDPGANVLDVEPGDASPAAAAKWVRQRLTAHSDTVAIVYTMMSDWQQVKHEIAALPAAMRSKVRYWIADPTGAPHVVAGANATQWYWGDNYDITTANPNFEN
jgi:hypothetical protein